MITEYQTPNGHDVTVLYLSTNRGADTTGIYHLQLKKQGLAESQLTESSRLRYENQLGTHVEQLSRNVGSLKQDFEIILTPPGSQDSALPYLERISRDLNVRDISYRFSKANYEIRAGDAGTDFETLLNNTIYVSGNDEETLQTIIIVDDVLASGKTVDVILQTLHDNGAPTSMKVVVAVPLRIIASQG